MQTRLIAANSEIVNRSKETLVNADAALKRLGGDARLLRDLIGFFLEDSPILLRQLDAAVASGDSEEAARAAHTLKGSAANFDAKDCVTTAAAIERAARQKDLKTAANLSGELHHLIDALRAELVALKF